MSAACVFVSLLLLSSVPVKLGVLIISAEVGQHRSRVSCLSPFRLVIKTAVDSTGKPIAAIHPHILIVG